MRRLWFSLAAGLFLAVVIGHGRSDRAASPAGSPEATAGNSQPARAIPPPRRDVPTARVAGAAALDDGDRDAIAALTVAATDEALDVVRGDAQSYWELSAEARAEYDRLEAHRLARLGVDDVTRRLAPHHEVLTLDGEEVTP